MYGSSSSRAVDVDGAVLDLDRLAGQADDPLDERRLRGPPWTQASGGSKTTMSPRE